MEKIICIEQQIEEVLNVFNKLKCENLKKGMYRIHGELEYKVTLPEVIRGKYQIEIIVTKEFPCELPIVKEVGGDIPKGFHKNTDEILCLGVETEIRIFLKNNPNLLEFIKSFVIPYFYSFKIWQRTGLVPFGERTHGSEGIVEFYKEYLFLKDTKTVLNVLKYTYEERKINKYHNCPCRKWKKYISLCAL